MKHIPLTRLSAQQIIERAANWPRIHTLTQIQGRLESRLGFRLKTKGKVASFHWDEHRRAWRVTERIVDPLSPGGYPESGARTLYLSDSFVRTQLWCKINQN